MIPKPTAKSQSLIRFGIWLSIRTDVQTYPCSNQLNQVLMV